MTTARMIEHVAGNEKLPETYRDLLLGGLVRAATALERENKRKEIEKA